MSSSRLVEILSAENARRHFDLWAALMSTVIKKADESLAATRVFDWEEGDNDIDAKEEALAAAVLRANMAKEKL